jgi:hypothetical protein
MGAKGLLLNNKQTRLALHLALFLFAIYLLIYRGGFHSIDEVSIFAVTESLVKFGSLDTNQIAWTQWTTSQAEAQGFFGRDGQVYSKKGLALSLAQAPLYGLALVLPGLGMLQTVSLLNALITAATAFIIFLFLQRMNFSLPATLVTVLIFALATISSIYAKYLFSEPLAGLLLLLAAYLLFAYKQAGRFVYIFMAGLAAGFAVLSRANNLFLLPIFGLYLLFITYRSKQISHSGQWLKQTLNQQSFIQAFSLFGLGLAVPGAILLAYNAARSGNPFQTGYDLTLFSSNILLGLYKLLFSPLRGLFIYSPILLLSLPGWWYLRRRYPAEAWLFAGLIGVTVALFSAWSSGEGLSWGSRFLVPVIPFFVISLAPLVEAITGSKLTANSLAEPETPPPTPHASRLTPHVSRFTFYPLLLLSVLIQLLGVAINPWVFLARLQAEFGGEFFLENTAALYDFRYSQIVGQLQSWSLENSDVAWWQPWGFDALAFGLSLGLVLLCGGLLWSQLIYKAEIPSEDVWPKVQYLALSGQPVTLFILTIISIAVAYFLLTRYYQTDRQFGAPEDTYTGALALAAQQVAPGEAVITIAPYHYHVPMNRFKARTPLLGFAQQGWPLPETALPILSTVMDHQTIWQVAVGFPPAAANNAAERWLTAHTFKVSDEWFPDEVRLVRFSSAQPTTTYPLNVRFGNEIKLLKVSLTPLVQSGQPLPVEFAWSASGQPQADYNIFLQLMNIDGALVAQHDSPPNGGYTPTSTWLAQQPVTSRHALILPPDLSPGDYRLIAGLYNPATGQRLLLDNGHDFIELGQITVTQAAGVES